MQPGTPSLDQIAIGVIASAITLAAEADARPPEWIKVTPRGIKACRDGRSFNFDPELLHKRFTSDGIDLPVDTDHSTVLLGAQGLTPKIVGYAGQLDVRDDGLYAKPDWNDAGLATHKARTHKFVSPSVHPDASGRTVWLHSIALVPAPALNMPALFHTTSESFMKDIATALGLPAASTEAACLQALQGRVELKPLALALGLPEAADGPALLAAVKGWVDLKPLAKALGLAETADAPACLAAIGTLKTGGGAVVTELQTQIATMATTITTMRKDGRDKEVKDLLDGALKERRIIPAQRASLELMCATDDGLKHTREMIKNSPEQLAPSGLGGLPEAGDRPQDPKLLAAKARKVQDDAAASGAPINFSEAMGQVLAAQAKG